MDYYDAYTKAVRKADDSKIENVIRHGLISDCVALRRADVHKGDCGRLLVCAGSVGLTGAATMACMSALRSGCGLVTLACPQELNTIFEIKLTEAMTLPLPSENGVITYDGFDILRQRLNNCSCFLMGPGLSVTEELRKLLFELIPHCRVPAVFDADAINILSKDVGVLENAPCPVILTPHIGEFSRLSGLDIDDILQNPWMHASEFALKYRCTVVLKSHQTVVADAEGNVYTNVLGNPGMAVGGCGDVLAGIIAALAAQGNTPIKSALAGVYLHSLAADIAVSETGEYSLLPTDISECLKYAIKYTQERI